MVTYSRGQSGARKRERERLRTTMAATGASVEEIAAEIGHRFRERPRAAFRYAHGMSQQDVADAYNELADTQGTAPMNDKRISSFERWPASPERPSVHVLDVLARIFHTSMNNLLDKDDYDHLPEKDRRLLERESTTPPAPFSLAVTASPSASVNSAPASHWPLRDLSVIPSGQGLSAAIAAIVELAQAIRAWQSAPVFGQPSWVELEALPGIACAQSQSGTLEALGEVVERCPVDRRDFTVLTGTGLSATVMGWLSGAFPLTATQAGRRIDMSMAAGIQQRTAVLRGLDDHLGGGEMLRVVNSDLRAIVGMLRTASYSTTVGQAMYREAAELCRVAGWVSLDSNLQASAQAYWFAGLRAARLADDPALAAVMLAWLSEQEAWLGNGRDALELAQAAYEHGKGHLSPRDETLIHLRAATAHAQLGEHSHRDRKLGEAAQAYGRDGGGEDPPITYWLGPAHLRHHIGWMYLEAGDWNKAVENMEAGMALLEADYIRDRANHLLMLGRAHLGQHEIEQTCAVIKQAMETLDTQVTSPRLASYLGKLRRDLQPYRKVAAVQELEESHPVRQ